MKAKVPKCHCLALQATSGRAYNPKLFLQGVSVPYIQNNPVGPFIQVPPDQHRVKDHLQNKLLSLLEKVDSAPVTRNQKLNIQSWRMSKTPLEEEVVSAVWQVDEAVRYASEGQCQLQENT